MNPESSRVESFRSFLRSFVPSFLPPFVRVRRSEAKCGESELMFTATVRFLRITQYAVQCSGSVCSKCSSAALGGALCGGTEAGGTLCKGGTLRPIRFLLVSCNGGYPGETRTPAVSVTPPVVAIYRRTWPFDETTVVPVSVPLRWL